MRLSPGLLRDNVDIFCKKCPILSTAGARILDCLIAMSDVCLQCRYYAQDPAHTFCDKHCARNAANNAPSLIEIPSDHVMYLNGMSLSLALYLQGQ